MVLWEITVATAYFLGLKRTYRLALKIQRRLVGPKHPKIRHFLQRRSRIAFDIALSVHKKIQQGDLQVGRNFGNRILRWLDSAKPSAQIRSAPVRPPASNNIPKHLISPGHPARTYSQNFKAAVREHLISYGHPARTYSQNFKAAVRDSGRKLFATPWNIRPKSFPTITMMMLPPISAGTGNQYRHTCSYKTFTPGMIYRKGSEGVFRADIVQWMLWN